MDERMKGSAIGDNVTFLAREKATALSERTSWPMAFAEGYIAGQSASWRGHPPSSYIMVGMDHFARGFRAGYFKRSTEEMAGRSAGRAILSATTTLDRDSTEVAQDENCAARVQV